MAIDSNVSIIPLSESNTRNSVDLEVGEPLDVFGLPLEAQEVTGLTQDLHLDFELLTPCKNGSNFTKELQCFLSAVFDTN